MGGNVRRRSCRRALAIVLLVTTRAAAQTGPPPPSEAGLVALAPYLTQIVRLASVDPVLAASLVPDAWIDSLLAGAFRIQAETASVPEKPDAPRAWPIGPWPSPASLVETIEAVDPAGVAALYRAASPRVEARCRAREATVAACESALRGAGSRLSSGTVLERASGEASPPVTPTQRELARLGVPVVSALRSRIHTTASRLWGAAWAGSAREAAR